MTWNAGTEPKHVAWHRLEKEGLWLEFQKTKKLLMRKPVSMPAKKAFVEALRRYPPPTASQRQMQIAEELRQADQNIANGKIDLHLDAEEEELVEMSELPDEPPAVSVSDEEAEFVDELELLAEITQSSPVDSDRDIEFAYRNMGLNNLTPSLFPSVPSWRWYCYARQNAAKFLEKYADRAEKRRKETAVGAEKFADDKRQQLAMLDKLTASMRADVEKTILELKSQYPFEFDAAIRKAGYVAKPAPSPTGIVV